MTFGKLKRLLLVSIIPLLLTGLLLFLYVNPVSRYVNLRCNYICKTINGDPLKEYERMKKDGMSIVEIDGSAISGYIVKPSFIFSQSFGLHQVRIDETIHYALYDQLHPEATRKFLSLKGRTASILMGIDKVFEASESEYGLFLECETLLFNIPTVSPEKITYPYTARCSGVSQDDGLTGIVSFTPYEQERKKLEDLKGEIQAKVNAADINYLTTLFAFILFPLALFLIASAIIFLIVKARRYVLAG